MKSFEQWRYEEVEDSFGIKRVQHHPFLMSWLDLPDSLSEIEQQRLIELRNELNLRFDQWNEWELEMFFISLLIRLVDYYQPQYRPFFERKLKAIVNNIEIGGVVDFLLAKGKQSPKQPYFCLHEYKWSRRSYNDPIGQLLSAMVCVQAKNNNSQQPIYGVIVEGKLWYFMILSGQEYSIAEPYNAARDDIFTIFKALKKVKVLIEPYI